MNKIIANFGRIFLTLVMVVIAGLLVVNMWDYYMNAPWTRDGKIRADVVKVAPDVTGFVSSVAVSDNEMVHKGDIIFTIDQARFNLAKMEAEAEVENAKAQLDQSIRDLDRYKKLDDITVTRKQLETAETQTIVAKSTYHKAEVALDTANLNIQRSVVRASVNGKITNFSLQPGDYVTSGTPVTALVDTDSFYGSGYFEENKLDRIHIGDKATIHIMGSNTVLTGVVEGVAAGIVDSERANSSSLLADISATFNWVRLAQRIPVRIKLDKVPEDIKLISGRTISVMIDDKK